MNAATQHPARLARLADLAKDSLEIYDDATQDALNGVIPCPRYALVTSEGSSESSYADNPNLTVHDSLESMAAAASGEYGEGWCVQIMEDLDTGEELGWHVRVEIES